MKANQGGGCQRCTKGFIRCDDPECWTCASDRDPECPRATHCPDCNPVREMTLMVKDRTGRWHRASEVVVVPLDAETMARVEAGGDIDTPPEALPAEVIVNDWMALRVAWRDSCE